MLTRKSFGEVDVWITSKDILDSQNKVEINWSALGSVSIKEAQDFSIDLQNAIKFAKEEAIFL